MKYMLWNNKGGVGKTLMSYFIASEYAIANPEVDVVVADMCPQANVSEMLLGGNGTGEANLAKYAENERTIASYIKSRYDKSRFGKTGTELTYFVNVSDSNPRMPSNLYLVPGDTDLDICSSIINFLSQAPERGAWLKSRSFLSDLIGSFAESRKAEKRDCVFFIDCNPSFANYTEMAVIASDRLIVPCTADSASIRGIHNLFRMIYGVEISDTRRLDDTVFDTFVSKAKDSGVVPPKIHMFVQNKSRSLDARATSAFNAHIKEIHEITTRAQRDNPDLFAKSSGVIENVKDGNTLASVVNHTGIPLSKIEAKIYTIYGKRTQTNKDQIERLSEDIDRCVAKIDR